MNKKITVIPMERRHIKEVAQLEALCFSKPWSEQGLLSELVNGTAHFFVAKNEGETIGYIGMHIVCDEAYIANLAVHPGHRKKGVGRTLLHMAQGFALGMGAKFLSLEVRQSNQPAISLYRSEGFKTAGRRKGFYTQPKEDALILTLLFD